ncbi:MAG TPA: glycosyltransferase, partial [Stellaceae bacterium]|nr:glycosyltransferase [Stellaceae bacterium]
PATVEASIVILTYRRPHGLMRALASCLAQTGVDGVEIVVVDNDPVGAARPIVEAAEGRFPVRYVRERRPGIAHARNAGVKAASGRYVMFLDDDEEAAPGWVRAFLDIMEESGADVAVGPVYPRFPASSRGVDRYRNSVFTREAGVSTGTPLARWGGIGNSILHTGRCFVGEQPFEPRLGLTGGEDALFLGRLARAGRRIVWCAEAAVSETVPSERLASRYLLRRAFHCGQITTYVHGAVRPVERAAVARWMAIGLVQVACCGPLGLALKLLGQPAWLGVLAIAASGLGKVLWHPRFHLRLYRPPSRTP